MKRIFVALSLAVLPMLMLSSCAKEDYYSGSGQTGYNPFGEAPAQSSQGSFTAKIDGSDFSAEVATAMAGGEALAIGGSKGVGDPQQLIMLSVTSTGTGTFPIIGGSGGATYKPAGGTAQIATSGEIVISERDDEHVKGTFHFVASGINVTDGAFDIKLTKQ